MKRVKLFGCSIISEKSADLVASEILQTQKPWSFDVQPFVYTPNTYNLVLFNYWHKTIFKELQKSAFILPDGFPLVLTSRLKRTPLASRMTGADLFNSIWKQLKEKKTDLVLFVCSQEEVGQKLNQEYPLASYYSPPFFDITNETATTEVINQVAAKIRKEKPLYVFMGIGDPKQQHVGIEVVKILRKEAFEPIPLFLYLGASFEFHLGLRKRAPIFYQKWGLEWFYRFANEPKKLFYRYFVLSWLFAPLMIREIVSKKT